MLRDDELARYRADWQDDFDRYGEYWEIEETESLPDEYGGQNDPGDSPVQTTLGVLDPAQPTTQALYSEQMQQRGIYTLRYRLDVLITAKHRVRRVVNGAIYQV